MHLSEDESARCCAHPQGNGVTRALMGLLTVAEGTVGGFSGRNSDQNSHSSLSLLGPDRGVGVGI